MTHKNLNPEMVFKILNELIKNPKIKYVFINSISFPIKDIEVKKHEYKDQKSIFIMYHEALYCLDDSSIYRLRIKDDGLFLSKEDRMC
ncbi:hypothetical protein [Cellulosilyticum sp. I15G10I2]|uniref:hypothetical protein n=1 Tax=Cellulosilyticum sp. I15G10I2 TaxID=1892843 RepID=UPI00085BB4E9|nr:hypothetical protein [Cellulosilyticum sp. I15G10I2]